MPIRGFYLLPKQSVSFRGGSLPPIARILNILDHFRCLYASVVHGTFTSLSYSGIFFWFIIVNMNVFEPRMHLVQYIPQLPIESCILAESETIFKPNSVRDQDQFSAPDPELVFLCISIVLQLTSNLEHLYLHRFLPCFGFEGEWKSLSSLGIYNPDFVRFGFEYSLHFQLKCKTLVVPVV